MKTLKFENPSNVLKYIQDGNDLYDVDEKMYFFIYNDKGAIAFYRNIDEDELLRLQRMAIEEGTSTISSCLGVGGSILDDPELYFGRLFDRIHTHRIINANAGEIPRYTVEVEEWVEFADDSLDHSLDIDCDFVSYETAYDFAKSYAIEKAEELAKKENTTIMVEFSSKDSKNISLRVINEIDFTFYTLKIYEH